MLCSKKGDAAVKRLSGTAWAFVLLTLCLNAEAAWHKASVRILSASSYSEGDIVLVDANAEIRLAEEVEEALSNGLPLSYDFTVEVRRARWLWWDETLVSVTRHLRIDYHELSRQYMIEDLDSKSQRTISDLPAALKELGTVRGMPIVRKSELEANTAYRARAHAELAVDEIPFPLWASSYLSAAWHLESGWYAWPLH